MYAKAVELGRPSHWLWTSQKILMQSLSTEMSSTWSTRIYCRGPGISVSTLSLKAGILASPSPAKIRCRVLVPQEVPVLSAVHVADSSLFPHRNDLVPHSQGSAKTMWSAFGNQTGEGSYPLLLISLILSIPTV